MYFAKFPCICNACKVDQVLSGCCLLGLHASAVLQCRLGTFKAQFAMSPFICSMKFPARFYTLHNKECFILFLYFTHSIAQYRIYNQCFNRPCLSVDQPRIFPFYDDTELSSPFLTSLVCHRDSNSFYNITFHFSASVSCISILERKSKANHHGQIN